METMVHYSNHTVTTETRALFETNKTATPKMAFPPQAKITKQKMLINLLFRINCTPFLFFRCNSMLNMAIFSLKKTTSDLLYQEIHFSLVSCASAFDSIVYISLAAKNVLFFSFDSIIVWLQKQYSPFSIRSEFFFSSHWNITKTHHKTIIIYRWTYSCIVQLNSVVAFENGNFGSGNRVTFASRCSMLSFSMSYLKWEIDNNIHGNLNY